MCSREKPQQRLGICRNVSPPVKLSTLISVCENSKDEFREMLVVLETSHVLGYYVVDDDERIPTAVSVLKSPFVDDILTGEWQENPGGDGRIMESSDNVKIYTPDPQDHPVSWECPGILLIDD